MSRSPQPLLVLFAALLTGTASALPALASAACPAPVETCCNFDDTKARSVGPLALGFHVWPVHLTDAVEEAARLSPRILRFSVGPNWRTRSPLPVDADYATVRDYVWRALSENESLWRRAASAHAELERRSGHVEQLMIIWEPPPSDADGPGLQAGAGRAARPEATMLNARFYLALVEGARQSGFRIDSLEIANEPDGAWNMRIPPAIYLDLVTALRQEADAQHVALPRIAGPGLAFLGALHGYFADRPLARRILAELDIVSVHAWDDRLGGDIVGAARGTRALLDELGWTAPIMVSEFAPTYPRASDREQMRGPDRRDRTGELVSDLPRYAPSTMELALGLAAEGFNPLVYWEFMDPPWGKTSYGLLTSGRAPRAAYRAWQDLARAASEVPIDRVMRNSASTTTFGLFAQGSLHALSFANATERPAGLRLEPGGSGRGAAPALRSRLVPCDVDRRDSFVMPPGEAVLVPARP